MVYKHVYLIKYITFVAFMLSVVKMLLKGEVGGSAFNSHGNYIVDHGKIMEYCVFQFLWEPCKITVLSTLSYFLFQGTGSNKGTPTRKALDVKNLKLKGVDKKLAETILNEVIDSGPPVAFSDIGKSC